MMLGGMDVARWAPCKVGQQGGRWGAAAGDGQCVSVVSAVPGEADKAAGCVTVSTPGSLPDMWDMCDFDIGGWRVQYSE